MKTKYVKVLTLFLVFLVQLTYAQNKMVSGTITDDSGLPLPGVNVIKKGSSSGTQSDFDGKYAVKVTPGDILYFSFVGFTNQEITISNQSIINIQMEQDTAELDEVVVVGLGQSKKSSNLIYSVSVVDTKEIVKSNEPNLINALAGKSTGIQINNSSGLAGSSSRVVIRGVSSLNYDNNPLYVIDGIPVSNQENQVDPSDLDQALFFGSNSNGTVDIAPDQIKSMSILKGAAASAIYGSRGANGVIIIETIKGKKDASPTFNFRSTTTLSSIIEPKFQEIYAQGREGNFLSGEPGEQTSLSWGPRVEDIGVPTYDRFDIFRDGVTYDNSVNVRGGSTSSTYFASLSAYNQEGTVPTNTFDRYSFLVNSSLDLGKKLKLSTKVNYINTINARPFEGNGLNSIMWTVAGLPITYNLLPSTDQNGEQRLYRTNRNNPYYILENSGNESTTNRYLPSLSLSYQLNDWINLKTTLGLDQNFSSSQIFENSGLVGTNTTGRLLLTERKFRDINSDAILTIDKNFSNKFTADYLLGSSVFDQRNFTQYSQGTSFVVPGFYDLSNSQVLLTDEITSKRRIISAFGQANFGYNNTLFLTVTGRNDWSSTLPINNNSFFYYSGSLGFDIAKVIDNKKILTRAMLKASYSRVGNDAPVYATVTNFDKSNPSDGQRGNIDFPFRGIGSFVSSITLGNPLLTPEFTNEVEVGADLIFLKGKIGLELSYYSKKSENQIFEVPKPASTGFSSIFQNAGAVENKGIEIALNLTPVETTNFRWKLGINYSKNQSEVLELADGVESVRLAGFTNPGIFIRKNEPYGVIWTTLYKRDENGTLLIDDEGYPQLGEIGNAGSVIPDWTGGLTTSFKYKKLELSAVMDIRVGGNIYNLDEFYTTFYGTSILTANRQDDVIIEGIQESNGQPNTTPIKRDFNFWRNFAVDEEFVQKSDFIKLRNITLAYNLPSQSVDKIGLGLSNIALSFSGRNLWIKTHDSFTGSDPELSLYGSGNGQGITNFQVPSNRSYSMSLNLTF